MWYRHIFEEKVNFEFCKALAKMSRQHYPAYYPRYRSIALMENVTHEDTVTSFWMQW